MLDKPQDVFGRDMEWADLADFVLSPLPGLRIAVVYGRRRQGKSYLLRGSPMRSAGCIIWRPSRQSRYRCAGSVTRSRPGRGCRLARWGSATGSEHSGRPRRCWPRVPVQGASPGVPPLLILDEFPYLCQETPGLPSIIQSLYDNLGPGARAGAGPLRLILCGSAISVMGDLLSGTKALRGRAALELRVWPFGYREAREYWGIGTPAAPSRTTPSSAVRPATGNSCPARTFPRTRPARQLAGAERPAAFHAAVRRSPPHRARGPAHPRHRRLQLGPGSRGCGRVLSDEDRRSARPPSDLPGPSARHAGLGRVHRPATRSPAGPAARVTVADPMVRFHQLIVEPYLADLEAGRAARSWLRRRTQSNPRSMDRTSRHWQPNGLRGMRLPRRASWSARSGRPSSPAANIRPVTRSMS